MKGGHRMANYQLKMHMDKHGDRQKDLAQVLGISNAYMNRKINGHAEFTRLEMDTIRERYSLSDGEFVSCFFSAKVS